jgi:hypothetical protein
MANLTKEQRAARQAEELQKQQAEQQQLEQQRSELHQQRQELEQQQQQLILQQEQLVQAQQKLDLERQQLADERQKFDAERNQSLLAASLVKPEPGEGDGTGADGESTFTPAEIAATVSMVRHYPEFPGGPTEARVHSDNVRKWIEHGWLVADEG